LKIADLFWATSQNSKSGSRQNIIDQKIGAPLPCSFFEMDFNYIYKKPDIG
jgi:hypothetical protein